MFVSAYASVFVSARLYAPVFARACACACACRRDVRVSLLAFVLVAVFASVPVSVSFFLSAPVFASFFVFASLSVPGHAPLWLWACVVVRMLAPAVVRVRLFIGSLAAASLCVCESTGLYVCVSTTVLALRGTSAAACLVSASLCSCAGR